ncbi:MAG: hypothetical protein HY553_02555 [Elusimicrobia bacterium]|nr:hypothetical protein [Elusimicrobiota bacterium]
MPRETVSPLEAARRRVLALAHHQAWARPGVTERYRRADLLRLVDHIIDGARRVATQLGSNDPQGWELLEHAAGLERVLLLEEDGELVA